MAADEDEVSLKLAETTTQLIEEVAKSDELNRQLNQVRRELETERTARTEIEEKVKSGQYVEKRVYNEELMGRQEAEALARRIQGELEELSATLFDDANQRVAAANKETHEVKRRNEQLQMQLEERDSLLENLQAQITGLKSVLEDMQERDQRQKHANRLSIQRSSTPQSGVGSGVGSGGGSGGAQPDSSSGLSLSRPASAAAGGAPSVSALLDGNLWTPIRPVARRDVPPFEDFRTMVHIRNVAHQVRDQREAAMAAAASGSSANTSTNSAASGSASSTPTTPDPGHGLSEAFVSYSHSPTQLRLHLGSGSSTTIPLKEFRFFKRTLADEIEPTLRLDLAPGLSWLGRRSLMSAIIDGTVLIEPISAVNENVRIAAGRSEEEVTSSSLYSSNRPVATKAPCTFCGESRDSSLQYARLHNLTIAKAAAHPHRDDDDKSAGSASSSGQGPVSTGYPLCQYCLNRVRSVCDFVVFMRSVRDGVWKIDDDATEQKAWDECVRLKERMFWARTGAVFLEDNSDNYYDEEDIEVVATKTVSSKTGEAQALRDISNRADTESKESIDNKEPATDEAVVTAVSSTATSSVEPTAEPTRSTSEQPAQQPIQSNGTPNTGALPGEWDTPNSDVQIHDVQVASAQPITVIQAEQIHHSYSSNDEEEFLDSYADDQPEHEPEPATAAAGTAH